MSMHKVAARKRLAFQIRELRKEKQVSQEGLAEACGLNRSYIGAIERAEHNIGIDNIEKVAHGLGVSIRRLVCVTRPGAPADVAAGSPVSAGPALVPAGHFLTLVEQYACEQPERLVAYLEHCGVRFSPDGKAPLLRPVAGSRTQPS